MPHLRKVVLHCPRGYEPRVEALVEEFIRDGVAFVGVVGPDCAMVEEIIDEIIVGNGDRDYFMLTSSHPHETVDEVVAFARLMTGDDFGEDVQVVELYQFAGTTTDGHA